jgi:hypothetical protein
VRVFYTGDYVAELHSGLSLIPVCQGWEHGHGIFQIKSCRFYSNAAACVNCGYGDEGSAHVC